MEFSGYRIDLEPHAEIYSRASRAYSQWRSTFDSYDWEPPDEIDPREWFELNAQGAIGSCFPAGTKVTMADGLLKNIEDVNTGEMVLSHTQSSRRVVATMTREYTGYIYDVFVKGWGHVKMTDDHPVLVHDGFSEAWIEAKDLRVGDRVVVSPGVHGVSDAIDLSKFVSGPTFESDDGLMFRSAGSKTMIPKSVALTDDFCFVLGLYAAEGSIDRSGSGNSCRVAWTLHCDEVYQRTVLVRYFSQFGIEASVCFQKKSKAVNVRVSCATWARFFEAACGTHCNRKNVPTFIASALSDGSRMSYLQGWLAGDGTYAKMIAGRESGNRAGTKVACRQVSGGTASRCLSQQLSTLAVSLGMKPGRSLRGKTARQNFHSYSLYFYSADAERLAGSAFERLGNNAAAKIRWSKSGQTRPIREIKKIPVESLDVYDFEVEKDHSFVAQGIIVHNCAGQAITDCAEYSHVLQHGEPIQLSRAYGYLDAQKYDGLLGNDSGSTLDGGTKSVAKGFPLERDFPYVDNYRTLLSKYRSVADTVSKPYSLRGEILLPKWEDAFRFLSSWQGAIQIGIMWTVDDTWEITSYRYGRTGGHSLSIVGYLKKSGWPGGIGFLLKNSWGPRWGRDGYALIHPNAYDQMFSHQWNISIGRSDMPKPVPRISQGIN